MSTTKNQRSRSAQVALDPKTVPPTDICQLIDAQADQYLEQLLEDADELPRDCDMMRGLLDHIKPFSKKLTLVNAEHLVGSIGLGNKLTRAMVKAKERHEKSEAKEKVTIGADADGSDDQSFSDHFSDAKNARPPNQKKTPRKPAGQKAQVRQAPEEPEKTTDQEPRGTIVSMVKQMPRTNIGKFAKWKAAIANAFDHVDEDAIEFMGFELTSQNQRVTLAFGKVPSRQEPK